MLNKSGKIIPEIDNEPAAAIFFDQHIEDGRNKNDHLFYGTTALVLLDKSRIHEIQRSETVGSCSSKGPVGSNDVRRKNGTNASAEVMKKYFIGSVLSGGGSVPAPQASAADWINMINEFQNGSLSTRLHILMIYGIDAIHGNNNVYKATIFPLNSGLGATRHVAALYSHCNATGMLLYYYIFLKFLVATSPGLGLSFGYVYASGTLNWLSKLGLQQHSKLGQPAFHMLLHLVCRDPRWGRCYESYSEDPQIFQAMTEMVPGILGDIPANSPKGIPFVAGNKNVAACAKHYVGDGGTTDGINENNTVINWHGLLSIHMPGYYTAIAKGVSTIMVSYSSWNGVKMHANHNLVTGFLKNTSIKIQKNLRKHNSDFAPLLQGNPSRHIFDVEFHAIDLLTVMVPYNYTEFIDGLTSLVKNNDIIPIGRIDDAIIHCFPCLRRHKKYLSLDVKQTIWVISVVDGLSSGKVQVTTTLHLLPGTEGQGVADVLFGDYGFTGKLPRTWFKTVDQLPMNVGDPLFPFGFGLTTDPTKITS
ncbi:putative polygalacturonase [Hibiscus syriacus]|uniref:Polygalacturonase n=1 Tax=Hibiscus syriacus TaxID=106335 RepID=A0A6A2Y8E8_HIBSY|nr:putative polygalacturonase [Hibiscus syriacus]